MSRTLAELEERASEGAVGLARSVLEADIANRAFSDQVGPALTQADVARLLGRSEQAVSKDGRLLRAHRFDGRPVYPVFQFNGRRQRPGLATVVRALARSVQPTTAASWLTAPNPQLAGRRPVDALDDGDLDNVVAVAARFADRMAV